VIRIAVDAMGGDHAPEATVRGALHCVEDPRCDFAVLLCGDRERIAPLLPASFPADRLAIEHAPGVVDMHDTATSAWRSKKDSSIIRALELHRAGEVQAVISAGHTGATMSSSTLILGRLPGIARPTIGTFLPRAGGWTLVVDAGANVDSKPPHLVQFAIMGSIYCEHVLGIARPRVGLLSVGEEETKGNETVLEAHRLLKTAPVNFVGNCEGRDILKGTVDVVVCDGFVGNIILKFAESIPSFLKETFKGIAAQGLFNKIAIGLAASSLRKAMKNWDYQEQGGVPLLGVNGVSLIGHGSSTPRAIMNMLFKAREVIEHRINEHIAAALQAPADTASPSPAS
jgi:phosphate acyltransferase